MTVSVIECKSTRQVVGDRADGIITEIRSRGLSGTDVLEGFRRVVGVAESSFAVERDEIFCIMGLSSSGKPNE